MSPGFARKSIAEDRRSPMPGRRDWARYSKRRWRRKSVSTTRPTLVNTDSVDEIARRSRGAENAPLEGREARLEKSTISCQAGRDGVLFFRKAHKPGWRFSRATRDQDFGLRQRGMTRNCPGGASEWRRTPRPHPEAPFAGGKGRLRMRPVEGGFQH